METVSLSDMLSQAPQEALRGFLRRWYGVEAVLENGSVPAAVPHALRRVYRGSAVAPELFSTNHLLEPSECDLDGDKHVFYVEEQGVALWGISLSDLQADDPPVWCRENEPGRPWVQDAPRVSVFLLQLAVMNAALTSPHGAGAAWLSPDEMSRALAPMKELALPAWHWPAYPSRFYAGDDVVAFAGPNHAPEDTGPPYLSVFVGGLTEKSIRFLEPHLTDAWEYCSLRSS